MLTRLAREADVLITVEDHVITGGLGTAVAEVLQDNNLDVSLIRLGIPDEHVPHGDPVAQHEAYGYGPKGIRQTLVQLGLTDRVLLEASD